MSKTIPEAEPTLLQASYRSVILVSEQNQFVCFLQLLRYSEMLPECDDWTHAIPDPPRHTQMHAGILR